MLINLLPVYNVFTDPNEARTYFIVAASFFVFIVVSFIFVKSIRIVRWFYMILGGFGYLFFAIFAYTQFLKYNACWQQSFIDHGYIEWAQHWDYTIYKDYFDLAMTICAATVFLFIWADRAFDVDYFIIKKRAVITNEFSWFKPTEIEIVEERKAHLYFPKILIFGIGMGIIIVFLPEFLTGFFASTYKHYFIVYPFEIAVAGLTCSILVFLFVRVMRQTAMYR